MSKCRYELRGGGMSMYIQTSIFNSKKNESALGFDHQALLDSIIFVH